MALEDFPQIPFDSFSDQLGSVLTATGNSLDRRWPKNRLQHPGSQALVHSLFLVAVNTYKTVLFITADLPPNPARKREYSLQAPPLARSVLDVLFTTVFLFGDLRKRTAWYYKSGWRELHEEHQRLSTAYGSSSDWVDYLKDLGEFAEKTRKDWGVTDEEARSPKLVKWWPIPSQMIADPALKQDRRDYLTFLNDTFYKTFSQDAHLSWPGLARRSFAITPNAPADAKGWQLDKFRSDSAMLTIVLVLALASELELEFRFDLKERLQYVWGVLSPYSGDARELHERFYAPYFRTR